MTDILKEIYFKHYLESHKPSPEYRSACRKQEEMLDGLLPELSGRDRDTMYAWQADVLLLSNLDWFREGFRLGASLMLELL